jgi:lysophospholipase L1-like esterase
MNTTSEAVDPHCLRPGEAGELLAGAPWRRVLVMGDSIAVHPGDPAAGYHCKTWAERLVAALRPATYRNLGRNGARVAEIADAQLAIALDHRPDLAVVAAGANDAARRSYAPAAVESVLDHMLSRLAGRGALVVTFGCFDIGRFAAAPPAQRAALSERFRTLGRSTAEVCHRYDGVHVDFTGHPAQDDGHGVLSADLLHINARGHAIVAADLIRALADRVSGSPDRRVPHSMA